jgi:hypothetical protein
MVLGLFFPNMVLGLFLLTISLGLFLLTNAFSNRFQALLGIS